MKTRLHCLRTLPALCVGLLIATGAMAQMSPANDARARYAQERQQCMTNNTQESLETCLQEARNARDAARRGQLTDPGSTGSDNATQRCAAFKTAADQAECVRRVQNAPVSGSVSGGGVLRESVTTTEIPPQ